MSFLLALLALVFAMVALSRSGKLRDRVQQLANQVMVLERLLDKAVKTSRAVPSGATQDSPAAAPAAAPPMATPPPVKPTAPVIAAREPVAPAATPPIVAPVPPPVRPVSPAMTPGPAPVAPARPPSPSPLHAPTVPDPVVAHDLRPRAGTESWETIIGGSWLNRIGIAMLVLGIAFALGYTLTQVGPLGKSLIAIATSLMMIAGGVLLERREAYAFYARGIIGGGWAILYATAYAIHELPATRIVESRLAGFAILLAVGVGMILHSLRYANEGLTTLAYGLGYAAIVLHSISPYTLAAATLLGLGTMLHLVRRRWYGAALGGIAATYGSLLVWYLRQETPTPQTLRLGLIALTIDWLVFLAPDFTTRPGDDVQRSLSRLVSLLNAAVAGAMALHVMTTMLPDRAWVAPAIFGALYALTSATLRRLDHPVVHQMHSVAAVVFVAIAAGKALSVTSATWIWLAEAQAVVLIGIGLKDRFHRWLGSILFLLPASAILLEQIRLRALRPDGDLDWRRLALNAAACGCFYLTQARLRAAFASSGDGQSEHETTLRRAFSYAAFALIALSLWVQLPQVWLAPAFAVLMLLLFEISALWKDEDLRTQTWLAAVTAAIVVLPFSASSQATLGRVPARSLALASVAAAWILVFFRLSRVTARVLKEDGQVRPLLSWAAATLVAGAVWLDARPTMIGPLWMILAILLIESGLGLGEIHLRRPGYLLLLGANVSLLLSNLTATSEVSGLSIRTATIVPGIAATYYLWWRLRALGDPAGSASTDPWDERIGRALSYVGAAMVGLYVRFQFGLEGAAMRWALTMIVLFLLADRLRDADIRIQAYALGIASLVRAIGFDFRQAGPVLGLDGPLVIALVCSGAYIAAALHLRWRAASSRPDRRALALEERLGRNGADVMWLMAVGLAALYAWRTQAGTLLIVIWSLEGLAATGAGFALGTKSLRIGGMVLLGLSIVTTLVRAFTTFDMMGRIVTFLVLGLVLLLVSFGYTRYRRGARNPS